MRGDRLMIDLRKWALRPETPWVVVAVVGVLALFVWLAFRTPLPTKCAIQFNDGGGKEAQVCLLVVNRCKTALTLDMTVGDWRETREIKPDIAERFRCIKYLEPHSVKLCYADGTKCEAVPLFAH